LVRTRGTALGFVGWGPGVPSSVTFVWSTPLRRVVLASRPKSVRLLIAVHTKNPWAKALYVTVRCFVLLRFIPSGPNPCHAMYPRGMEVADSVFCIVVYQRRNTVEPEVVEEDSIIIRVAIRVHTCLEACHNVGVL
jgi:hypothetical protein